MTTQISTGTSEKVVHERPAATESELPSGLFDHLYDGVYAVDAQMRITRWNKGAEQLTGYSAQEVIGMRNEESILMHVAHDSAEHPTESIPADTVADGRTREVQCEFRHKEGHWIRVRARSVALRQPTGVPCGAFVIFSDNLSFMSMKQRMRELRHLALSDPLTELGNRRYGMMSLHLRLDEMRRYGWPFGVLFVDLDRFKSVNDTFGHDVGDRALRMVARTLSHNVRPFDVVARWGGEEFLVIIANIRLPELTHLADKLRSLIEHSCFFMGLRRVRVTVTLGATVARPDDTEDSVVERADRLMYRGKRCGKNRVFVDEAL